MSNALPAERILVPLTPTPEMLLAGHHKIDWCRDGQKTNVMEDPSQVEVISGQSIGTTCKQDLIDAWEAMLAAAPQRGRADVETAWQELLEKDDRTSPEERPDMLLITREELADFMATATREDAQPVGHFQHSSTWDAWEEVSPEYAGSEGVVPLYRRPASGALGAAVEALVNEFAWSAVTADCEEARAELQSRIDAVRAALHADQKGPAA